MILLLSEENVLGLNLENLGDSVVVVGSVVLILKSLNRVRDLVGGALDVEGDEAEEEPENLDLDLDLDLDLGDGSSNGEVCLRKFLVLLMLSGLVTELLSFSSRLAKKRSASLTEQRFNSLPSPLSPSCYIIRNINSWGFRSIGYGLSL